MILLLPPIIFQDTLHLDVGNLIEDSDSIMAYAFAGTLVMLSSVAFFLYVFMGFSVLEAVLLGIIISPTDPVAVINTFHSLGVNKRFEILVTGESLFNDGIAIAIYSVIVSLITLGSITLFDVANIGMMAIIGGTFLGLLFGYAAHIFFCWTDDKFAEVLVSFIVAFGVFQLSEILGASGVISVVVAGLIINYRTRFYGGMGRESIEMLEALWEFVGFMASSIAFIFIGMNLNLTVLLANIYPILVLFVFTLLSRYLMVVGIAKVVEATRGKNLPENWRSGISWSGLRGAVSVVLSLGVSSLVLPNSDVIVALTFGVVLLSNIVQGLTISPVLKKLNLALPKFNVGEDLSHREIPPNFEGNYSTKGYQPDKPRFEKLIFSSPEYFVMETRFGGWIADRLRGLLELMNRYSMNSMHKRAGGFLLRFTENLIDLISNFLNWFNLKISKKEGDTTKSDSET
jgi:CPA1 family monovalent cation:H+ antiporter